ncbi:MAG: peroxiredoxin family protein [Candidatus Eutrophobiaceae bacterium]
MAKSKETIPLLQHIHKDAIDAPPASATYWRVLIVCLLMGAVWAYIGGGRLVEAPNFTASTLDMESISMQERLGKPTLITFWSVTCIPCVNEIPELSALHRKFSDSGFSVIGISMSYDKLKDIKRLRSKKNIPYPLIYDDNRHLQKLFGGIKGTPTTFLIDPKGKIARKFSGGIARSQHHKLIEEINKML